MFILASQSPRRKQLLKKIVKDFLVVPSDIDETKITAPSNELALEKAKAKASDIKQKYPNDIILGCDTIVIINDEVLEKPTDKKDAFKMLKTLSGKTHIVLTGYSFICGNTVINRTVKSEVVFNELSDELIWEYIATGSPMDKAGAYGFQDNEKFNLISKIIGSCDNVIGLPTEDIEENCSKYYK